MDDETTEAPGRWAVQPETMALRVLQTAMTDAETAMARRMQLGQTDMAIAGGAMPRHPEAAELLGVEMDELAGALALIADDRRSGLERLELA